MKLFDESENKYYELLAFLLRNQEKYTSKELNEIIQSRLQGKQDFEITDVLFASDEENRLFFKEDQQLLQPIMETKFPIRTNIIENQAAKSLLLDKYICHFLRPQTIEKLKAATADIKEEWSISDIKVKNMFCNGDSEATESMYHKLSAIVNAIRQGKSIRYDNVRPGRVDRKGEEAFPVKIEISIMNDKIRVCACDLSKSYFFKANLEFMNNVSIGNKFTDTEVLQHEYMEFIEEWTKKLVLDVEPTSHVIERCFRVFSYYDRKARYDKEEERYRLEISYMEQDEKEIIKNILSMGSYVTVLEPRSVQKEVYRRILAASKLYEE